MIRDSLERSVRDALAAIGVDPPASVQLERPARREHGDWSSNVALATAKKAGRQPRELARRTGRAADRGAARARRAGRDRRPGVRELPPRPTWLHDVLAEVVTEGVDGYARLDIGDGAEVNVEFVSANPTGPLHAGTAGGRPTATRSPSSSVAATTVTREYYLNDRGTQMQLFAASLAAAEGRANRFPRAATRASTSSSGRPRCPTAPTPRRGARRRRRRDLAATLARHGRRLRHVVQRAVARRQPAPSKRRSTTSRPRRGLRERRRHVAAQHRLRRRQGPRARQVRRRVHLPAARHRLPPRQVRPWFRPAHRRVGCRPPRLRGADEGRHAGARPRSRRARDHPRPARAPRAGRRAGAAVEARRRHRAARRRARRGRSRRRPGSPTCCSRSTARRPSTSTWSPRRPWRTRSSTCRWPTPASPASRVGRGGGRRTGAARPTSTCRCWRTSASSRCCGRCSSCPRSSPWRARAGAAQGHDLGARAGGPFHGFYHDCYVIGEDVPPELTQARLWLVESAGSASPSGSTCSACPPRSRCRSP